MSETFAEVPNGCHTAHTLGLVAHWLDSDRPALTRACPARRTPHAREKAQKDTTSCAVEVPPGVTLPTREDTDFRRAQLKRLTRTAALTAGGLGTGRHVFGLWGPGWSLPAAGMSLTGSQVSPAVSRWQTVTLR